METETPDALFREALRDKLRIQGSSMSNRDELLQKLTQAMKTIAPSTMPYFDEKEPLAAGSQGKAYDKQTIREANIVLREIRSAFNEFWDYRWQALLAIRNHLLGSLVLTEIVTYSLLCLVILAGVNQPVLLTALTFYVVGAIAGLFVRFYSESRNSSTIDNFGHSTVRLVVIPLQSGLTAIGGVLLVTVLLATFNLPEKFTSLSALFTFVPQLWLVAAFFGIIPNVIIKGFQKQVDTSTRELKSGKEVTGTDEIEPSLLTTIDRQLDQIYKYNVNQVRRWSGLSIAATTVGFLIILSGIAVIFIGNTLLGVVILLLGVLPEIGAFLAFQQRKYASEQLNQMRSQVQGKTPLETPTPPLKEQEQTISTVSSSTPVKGDKL